MRGNLQALETATALADRGRAHLKGCYAEPGKKHRPVLEGPDRARLFDRGAGRARRLRAANPAVQPGQRRCADGGPGAASGPGGRSHHHGVDCARQALPSCGYRGEREGREEDPGRRQGCRGGCGQNFRCPEGSRKHSGRDQTGSLRQAESGRRRVSEAIQKRHRDGRRRCRIGADVHQGRGAEFLRHRKADRRTDYGQQRQQGS